MWINPGCTITPIPSVTLLPEQQQKFNGRGAALYTKLKRLEKCEHLKAKTYINNCTNKFMMHPTEIINNMVLHIRLVKILYSCLPKNYWSYSYLFISFQSETKHMNLLYDNGLHGTLELIEDTPITEENSPYLHVWFIPTSKTISSTP